MPALRTLGEDAAAKNAGLRCRPCPASIWLPRSSMAAVFTTTGRFIREARARRCRIPPIAEGLLRQYAGHDLALARNATALTTGATRANMPAALMRRASRASVPWRAPIRSRSWPSSPTARIFTARAEVPRPARSGELRQPRTDRHGHRNRSPHPPFARRCRPRCGALSGHLRRLHGLEGHFTAKRTLSREARANPWESLHKILNGHPDEAMPALRELDRKVMRTSWPTSRACPTGTELKTRRRGRWLKVGAGETAPSSTGACEFPTTFVIKELS